MGFFGCGKPVVYLKYKDNPANLNAKITLPDPAGLVPEYDRIAHEVTTLGGRLSTKRLGHRPSITITWLNVSSADFSNMTKIANWGDDILLLPHSDHPLIGYNAEVTEFKHSYPKDKAVEIDIVVMTFKSVLIGPIRNYDNLINAQWGHLCDDQPIQSGVSLLLNGDFTNWTADDPDDWLVENEDANNYITESASKAKIVSNDTGEIKISQNIMSASSEYILTLDVTNVTLGQLEWGNSGVFNDIPTVIGTYTVGFTAGGTKFAIRRKAACNITIDNVILKSSSDKDLQLTFDEAIYT